MELYEIEELLDVMKNKYSQDMGIVTKLEEDKRCKEEELKDFLKEKEELELQRALLNDASVEARKNAKDILEMISTKALQFIIGDYMSLQIQLDEKGNSPVAEFVVQSQYDDYSVEADPAEEEGGGIADIVSFSSNIAMLELTSHQNVAPLFLDEPSKYISKGNSENVGKFLYEISREYNRQVIMVTHDDYLAKIADTSYHLQIDKNGKTEAKKIGM